MVKQKNEKKRRKRRERSIEIQAALTKAELTESKLTPLVGRLDHGQFFFMIKLKYANYFTALPLSSSSLLSPLPTHIHILYIHTLFTERLPRKPVVSPAEKNV